MRFITSIYMWKNTQVYIRILIDQVIINREKPFGSRILISLSIILLFCYITATIG